MFKLTFPSSLESGMSFPGFVCTVCLKSMAETPLQRCSGCKLFFYCGKEHQKLHWLQHKELCKVIQSLGGEALSEFFVKIALVEKKARKSLVDSVVHLCEKKLKRRLTVWEYSLFSYPFICKVCGIYKGNCMMTCHDCCLVTYCSIEHKEKDKVEHSLICKEYNKKLSCYYKSCVENCLIFSTVSSITQLPGSMESFIEKLYVTTNPPGKESVAVFHLSKMFTIPLTLIYVIEKGMPEIKNNKLNIHVVGCQLFENSALLTWEFMFHYFKWLKSLNLVFIGPDTSPLFVLPPVLLCNECKSKNLRISASWENVKYHEYLKKKKSEDPNVIIAFHCGFYDYKCLLKNEIWKDSMESLCSFPGAVVAFTSYREKEAPEDLKIFKESCGGDNLEFLVESELNPYRGILPVIPVDDLADIGYHNHYISIVRKSDY